MPNTSEAPETGTTPGPDPAEIDPDTTWGRLNGQLAWYDKKSASAKAAYKRIKIIEIIAAAMIPFVTGQKWEYMPYIVGSLGVIITILEGILQLNKYQENWTSYRNTAESLKHEKFLFLAKAGPYASAADPHVALAERVEALLSQENSQWIAALQKSAQTASKETPA